MVNCVAGERRCGNILNETYCRLCDRLDNEQKAAGDMQRA
jgi:hypothetical protein